MSENRDKVFECFECGEVAYQVPDLCGCGNYLFVRHEPTKFRTHPLYENKDIESSEKAVEEYPCYY